MERAEAAAALNNFHVDLKADIRELRESITDREQSAVPKLNEAKFYKPDQPRTAAACLKLNSETYGGQEWVKR